MFIEEWIYTHLSFQGIIFFFIGLYLTAIILSVRAIMTSRSSQGALAWSISLISFPTLVIPFYLLFGRRKFHGYIQARREGQSEIDELGKKAYLNSKDYYLEESNNFTTFQHLTPLDFTSNNKVSLDIDGEKIYASMLREISLATEYILVQFYIIRDDSVGEMFKKALALKAKEGVRIYLLYDEIGCFELSDVYLSELRYSKIHVVPFVSTQGRKSRFQINFRNHRKMLIIDGKRGILGGANLGKEYIENQQNNIWRDTNILVEGPAVLGMQIPFVEDWFWSSGDLPEVSWTPTACTEGNQKVLILPTGPADRLETCELYFQQAIFSAKERIWITSPYFIPDEAILQSLILACFRGVEVKILIPEKSDNELIDYAVESFIYECLHTDIQFYKYKPGFLHQKVILIDSEFASISTANLDTRSMRLNFEVSALVIDREFNKQTEEMLSYDFLRSEKVTVSKFDEGTFFYKFKVKLSKLFSPIL